MTTLLLDFRWDLDAILNDPDVTFSIIRFVKLWRRTGLNPAPFVEDQQWQQWGPHPGVHWEAWAALGQFLDKCSRPAGSMCAATPDPQPQGLRDNWKRALRDQLSNPAEWRSPQIIVPKLCCNDWPSRENEVNVRCEPCGNQPASDLGGRVLAVLEEYDSHPIAVPDIDPWRHLEWLYPPEHDAANKNPCRLPRPPILDGIPIEELSGLLIDARRDSWTVNGRYYFIPPMDWRPEQIKKTKWRNGYAFSREKVRGWKGPCPIDYKDRTWRWDSGERHWDIQVDPPIRVRYDGLKL